MHKNNDWQLCRKRHPNIRIRRFTPDMADKTVKGDTQNIYYLHTREGYRMIDESMYVADKGHGYTHPMCPNVFNQHYVVVEQDVIQDAQTELQDLKNSLGHILGRHTDVSAATLSDREAARLTTSLDRLSHLLDQAETLYGDTDVHGGPDELDPV